MILPLLALFLVVVLVVAAFTIDLERTLVLRRDLQRIGDIAALDASRVLSSTSANSQLATIRAAAVRSANRNHWRLAASDVHLVRRSGSDWVRVDATSDIPDGVEAVTRGSVDYDFQPGGTSTTRDAVAARSRAAGVEIGTYVGSINTSHATMLTRSSAC